MNDLKRQDSDHMSKPSVLFKYRIWIFLSAVAVISVILALYLTRGFQKRQEASTDATPSTTTISSPSAMPVSPISPLLPASPAPTPSESTSLDPITIQSMAERGIQLYESENYTEALKLFSTIVDADPHDARAYDMRGTIYTALNDYEHAMNDYDKAVELNPSFAQAYYNRGRAYSFLTRYDEALSDLQKSIELDSAKFGYRANGNIGFIYHQQGQYDKALDAFATSISYDNTKADVFYLRGETYTTLGEYDAAITDYRSAIGRFARYDFAYQSLGYAYYKTAQYDKAAEALNQAVSISPDSPTAHLYLALVAAATGNPDDASVEVTRATKSFATLPQEEQRLIYSRVAGDLKTFAQQHPDKAKEVEALIVRLPQPQ